MKKLYTGIPLLLSGVKQPPSLRERSGGNGRRGGGSSGREKTSYYSLGGSQRRLMGRESRTGAEKKRKN